MGINPRKIIAAGATALLVGASTILIAAPASAADFYVDDSELGATEVSPYPDGWFQGNVTAPAPAPAYASTLSGLDVDGQFQLLYGVIGDNAPGTGLDASVPAEFVAPDITLAGGTATFQIPVFTAGGAAYTTLYADAAGIAGDVWYSSNAYNGIVADTPTTLATLVGAMDADYQILAFGFHVVAADAATVVSLDWAGDTYWFLPAAPTASVAPASITQADFAASGVTGTFTGFVPGETVEIGLGTGSSGGGIGSAVADGSGAVTFAVPTTAATAAGTYSLSAFGATSGVSTGATFEITAALAPTGADAAAPLVLGGTLLLAGLAFVLVTQVRRKRAADIA